MFSFEQSYQTNVENHTGIKILPNILPLSQYRHKSDRGVHLNKQNIRADISLRPEKQTFPKCKKPCFLTRINREFNYALFFAELNVCVHTCAHLYSLEVELESVFFA